MIVIKSRLTAFTDIRIYCLIHIIYPSRDPSRVNASEAFLFPAFLLPLRNLPTGHVSGHVQVPKERPTSSQSAFPSIMNVLMEKYNSEERSTFFKREKGHNAPYRRWLGEINRHGGTKFYEALPEHEVTKLFRTLAESVRENTASA